MTPTEANGVVGRTRDGADNGDLRGWADGRTIGTTRAKLTRLSVACHRPTDVTTCRQFGSTSLGLPVARQSDSKYSELLKRQFSCGRLNLSVDQVLFQLEIDSLVRADSQRTVMYELLRQYTFTRTATPALAVHAANRLQCLTELSSSSSSSSTSLFNFIPTWKHGSL